MAYEVFEDVGIADHGDFGANDNQFNFLDYGRDGIPNTQDQGDGDGIHDPFEPSEPFSDLNGNGRYDGFSGAFSSSVREFGNTYSLEVRDGEDTQNRPV